MAENKRGSGRKKPGQPSTQSPYTRIFLFVLDKYSTRKDRHTTLAVYTVLCRRAGTVDEAKIATAHDPLKSLLEKLRGLSVCWPGIKLIAKETGLKERAVQKHLEILITDGVVLKQSVRDDRGQHSNLYILPEEPVVLSGADVDGSERIPGAPQCTGGDASECTGGEYTGAPITRTTELEESEESAHLSVGEGGGYYPEGGEPPTTPTYRSNPQSRPETASQASHSDTKARPAQNTSNDEGPRAARAASRPEKPIEDEGWMPLQTTWDRVLAELHVEEYELEEETERWLRKMIDKRCLSANWNEAWASAMRMAKAWGRFEEEEPEQEDPPEPRRRENGGWALKDFGTTPAEREVLASVRRDGNLRNSLSPARRPDYRAALIFTMWCNPKKYYLSGEERRECAAYYELHHADRLSWSDENG